MERSRAGPRFFETRLVTGLAVENGTVSEREEIQHWYLKSWKWFVHGYAQSFVDAERPDTTHYRMQVIKCLPQHAELHSRCSCCGPALKRLLEQ